MLSAQLQNRIASIGLLEDRDDLAVSISCFLHAESPAFILRGNSTFEQSYFPGGNTL